MSSLNTNLTVEQWTAYEEPQKRKVFKQLIKELTHNPFSIDQHKKIELKKLLYKILEWEERDDLIFDLNNHKENYEKNSIAFTGV